MVEAYNAECHSSVDTRENLRLKHFLGQVFYTTLLSISESKRIETYSLLSIACVQIFRCFGQSNC